MIWKRYRILFSVIIISGILIVLAWKFFSGDNGSKYSYNYISCEIVIRNMPLVSQAGEPSYDHNFEDGTKPEMNTVNYLSNSNPETILKTIETYLKGEGYIEAPNPNFSVPTPEVISRYFTRHTPESPEIQVNIAENNDLPLDYKVLQPKNTQKIYDVSIELDVR